jgi:hypothetical protein
MDYFSFLGLLELTPKSGLSYHDSNLNSTFVIMNELKFLFLTRVLTQNFNTMDLVKFLKKNQNLHNYIETITLKVTSCKTMRENKRKS